MVPKSPDSLEAGGSEISNLNTSVFVQMLTVVSSSASSLSPKTSSIPLIPPLPRQDVLLRFGFIVFCGGFCLGLFLFVTLFIKEVLH